MRKPVYAICAKQRRRSACAFAQSEQCLCFHWLGSIIPLVSISEISSVYLASVAAQAGLSLPWWQTPKTVFLMSRLKCVQYPRHGVAVTGHTVLSWRAGWPIG